MKIREKNCFSPWWDEVNVNLYILQTVHTCTLSWVNLYQKLKMEKYTVCGKLFLPKKMQRHFFKL